MDHIKRLPTDVVNRIAAGEVVQRPSAALKELLENSLDAGATAIHVSAADGGLEALQVCDDGCGVRSEDLPLLCERYATSKLRCFEDLRQIGSFGFRGEAMASLSYVSRVTVTTRRRPAPPGEGEGTSTEDATSSSVATRKADVAWRCRYMDGKLTEAPQPCAGNLGTTVRAEKMFYKASVRRAALRPSEEWSRIVDVVTRYALAFPQVAFSCQREGGSGGGGAVAAGLSFQRSSTTLANVRLAHGNAVASRMRLLHYCSHDAETSAEVAPCDDDSVPPGRKDPLHTTHQQEDILARVRDASQRVEALSGDSGAGAFTLHGYTSDPTLPNRKSYFCFFINRRLVESAAVRRAVDAAYAGALSGGNRPFTILFLVVPADRVDVNVHPTKKEVCLLDEELVLAHVTELVRRALLRAAEERQLGTMRIGGGVTTAAMAAAMSLTRAPYNQGVGAGGTQARSSAASQAATAPAVVIAPSAVVRVEPQKGALEKFLRPMEVTAVAPPTNHSDCSHHQQRVPTEAPATSTSTCAAGASMPPAARACAPDQPQPAVEWSAVMASVKALADTESESGSNDDHDVEILGSQAPQGGGAGKRPLLRDADSGDDTEDVMADFKRFRLDLAKGAGVAAAVSTDSGEHEQQFSSIADFLSEKDAAAEGGRDANASAATASDMVAAGLPVPELHDYVLSSVQAVTDDLRAGSGATAQAFFSALSLVGVVDARCCLAQSGTSLYLLDTLALAREVAYQRAFLRWAQPSLSSPPRLVLHDAQPVRQLLYLAIRHDMAALRPLSPALRDLLREAAGGPSISPDAGVKKEAVECSDDDGAKYAEAAARLFDNSDDASMKPRPPTRRYVARLCRVLYRWREMLREYFGVEISADGLLTALPHGLNESWPPLLRAAPLLLWLLAEAVPYPNTPPEDDPSATDCAGDNRPHQHQQHFSAPVAPSSPESGGRGSQCSAEADVRAEIACFTAVATHIANALYGLPHKSWMESTSSQNTGGVCPALTEAIQFGLFPTLKSKQLFLPPARFLVDGTVQAVVSVESLYKVFERC